MGIHGGRLCRLRTRVIIIRTQMYRRRTPGSKRDPVKQWALPDRVFFAAGACHILAYAFLEAHPERGFQPFWIRPAPGHTGNHIVVARDAVVFDYHGYSHWSAYWAHTKRRANQQWPGWDADVLPISREALVSNAQAEQYDGLRMKEPSDYLFDPLPRARWYLGKFPAPTAAALSEVYGRSAGPKTIREGDSRPRSRRGGVG
jgi:hypothetical protein